jgi:hypothetical protein
MKDEEKKLWILWKDEIILFNLLPFEAEARLNNT